MTYRRNLPVRAPRAIHDELNKAARAQSITLAEYLERLATDERIESLLRATDKTGSTYINPRTKTARRICEISKVLGCRQWDAWLALHRLAVEEDAEGGAEERAEEGAEG